jgi:putative FmdB family regulatory protein
MPIYEYTCRKCQEHVEIMQKVSDKPLTRHSKCGGKLEKQWSQTSFQLKGSGWYVTDYAGKKTDAKEGAEPKEGKDARSESASETTSAPDKPEKASGGEKSKEKAPKASAPKPRKGSAPAGD